MMGAGSTSLCWHISRHLTCKMRSMSALSCRTAASRAKPMQCQHYAHILVSAETLVHAAPTWLKHLCDKCSTCICTQDATSMVQEFQRVKQLYEESVHKATAQSTSPAQKRHHIEEAAQLASDIVVIKAKDTAHKVAAKQTAQTQVRAVTFHFSSHDRSSRDL